MSTVRTNATRLTHLHKSHTSLNMNAYDAGQRPTYTYEQTKQEQYFRVFMAEESEYILPDYPDQCLSSERVTPIVKEQAKPDPIRQKKATPRAKKQPKPARKKQQRATPAAKQQSKPTKKRQRTTLHKKKEVSPASAVHPGPTPTNLTEPETAHASFAQRLTAITTPPKRKRAARPKPAAASGTRRARGITAHIPTIEGSFSVDADYFWQQPKVNNTPIPPRNEAEMIQRYHDGGQRRTPPPITSPADAIRQDRVRIEVERATPSEWAAVAEAYHQRYQQDRIRAETFVPTTTSTRERLLPPRNPHIEAIVARKKDYIGLAMSVAEEQRRTRDYEWSKKQADNQYMLDLLIYANRENRKAQGMVAQINAL